jgi:hypothetical protein
LGEGWWEVVIGSAGVDMHLSADRLAAVSLMTVLLALPFGALALAVSCAVGRRGVGSAWPLRPPARRTSSTRSA